GRNLRRYKAFARRAFQHLGSFGAWRACPRGWAIDSFAFGNRADGGRSFPRHARRAQRRRYCNDAAPAARADAERLYSLGQGIFLLLWSRRRKAQNCQARCARHAPWADEPRGGDRFSRRRWAKEPRA